MRKVIFCIIVCLTAGFSFAQDKNAYTIFDSKGNVASYSDLVNRSAATDVVFFGELHDNPIAHWLELELAKDLFRAKNGSLIMGAEMFEADNQLILDEYMSGLISMKRFEDEAKLCNNYQTDYKPLVEFAKESGVRFVATNIPRRYASAVAGGGFEVLNSFPDEARKFFAPLPVAFDPELPGYKAMMGMDNMHGAGMQASQNLPKSQALKDATMAHFIMANFKEGSTLISNEFKVKGDIESAEKFAAILGTTTPDTQESTIALKYLKEGETAKELVHEYSIKVSDADKTLKSLREAEIFDYSLNESDGTLKLLDFSLGEGLEFKNKLRNLLVELKKEGVEYGEQTKRDIDSRYIDPGRRGEILEGLAGDAEFLRQGGGSLREVVEQSRQRHKEYTERVSDAKKTSIHYNGSYHSDNKEGIVWYINRTNPNLRVVTVATVMQTDVDKLDAANLGIADFIIVVPESMTRTY